MTYDLISYENLFISGFAIAISALVVAVLTTLAQSISQTKQPELKPIPIRVRRDDVRHLPRRPRDFR